MWAAAADAKDRKSEAPRYAEDDVKAALLLNFALYTEWPAGSEPPPTITFCLFGIDDPSSFETVLADRTIGGREAVVARVEEVGKISGCQVLFVREADADERLGLLRRAETLSILAVGEDPAFLEIGGHLALVVERERVRFDLNLASLERSNLRLSSRVIRLARRLVETKGEVAP